MIKKIKNLSVFVLATLLGCSSVRAKPLNLEELAQKVKSEQGIVGEIHGAAHDYNQYVLSIRNPENFFEALQFPLLSRDPDVVAILKTTTRHDKVKVWGEFKNLETPQKHIAVKKIEIVKKYISKDMLAHEYSRPVVLPEGLKGKTTIKAVVHAVFDEGKILLIDYEGSIIPIFTRDYAESIKKLYRTDSVEIDFEIQEHPKKPVHLVLKPKGERAPLRVLHSIVTEHGQKATREGSLLLFPQSPQVKFNVFALEYINEFGLKFNYTLINFEDMKLFEAIRNKLQAAWDKVPKSEIINDRNKLLAKKVRVKATGIINVVDPGQANPQVILNSLDDLEIVGE